MSANIAMEGLTFDDLLLLPGYTDFRREDTDLQTVLHPNLVLKLPVLSSPMDTVTEEVMAATMAQNGGLGIIHRNLKVADQAEMVRKAKSVTPEDTEKAAVDASGRLLVGAAVGAGADLAERIDALIEAEVDLIVVDSGHGHAKYILDAVAQIKKRKKDQIVAAGNVATAEGAKALVDVGTDVIRAGVGPGSICTTRVITGMGVPQMTTIFETVKGTRSTSSGQEATVIADGGIRQMGDMGKALGAGAHAVMLGSMLAGFEQSAGETVTIDEMKFKKYRGMGSITAMKKGGAERYGQSKDEDSKKLIAEGVEGLVNFKGDANDFLYQIAGSLRSSFYYVGGKDLSSFHKKASFVKITNAGLKESHPHTITVESVGGNYL